jgi:hypothetical protein
MKAPTKNANKKFFYLVAATVVFAVRLGKDKMSEPTMMPINTVVTGSEDRFPSAAINRAQQAVQLALFKRLGDDAQNVEVGDVVINNLMNLGYMTDEEFNVQPAPATELPAEIKKQLELVK